MFNLKLLILLVCLTVNAQGNINDLIVDFMKMASDHVSDRLENINYMKQDAVKTLRQNYDETYENLKIQTKNKVDDAIQLTKAKTCQQNVMPALYRVGESPEDRFLSCLNFTDTITDLGKYIYSIGEELVDVEEGFCDVIQNVTSCTGNILEEIHCGANGIMAYIQDFKHHSSSISNVIVEINKKLKKIAYNFIKCFTTIDGDITKSLSFIIQTNCK